MSEYRLVTPLMQIHERDRLSTVDEKLRHRQKPPESLLEALRKYATNEGTRRYADRLHEQYYPEEPEIFVRELKYDPSWL